MSSRTPWHVSAGAPGAPPGALRTCDAPPSPGTIDGALSRPCVWLRAGRLRCVFVGQRVVRNCAELKASRPPASRTRSGARSLPCLWEHSWRRALVGVDCPRRRQARLRNSIRLPHPITRADSPSFAPSVPPRRGHMMPRPNLYAEAAANPRADPNNELSQGALAYACGAIVRASANRVQPTFRKARDKDGSG